MNLIQKYTTAFFLWTGALILSVYLAFPRSALQSFHLEFFILFVIAGTTLNFMLKKWEHPFEKEGHDKKEDAPFKNFISKIEFHYQCYDKNWTNLFGFLLLFLLSVVIFLISPLIFKNVAIPANNYFACLGVFVPYFFHKAYYFSTRIPELKPSVYVYYENKRKIKANVREVYETADRIEEFKESQREFNGWLLNTVVLLTDVQANIFNKKCSIPLINQDWSYKQVMDIVFYQNKQTEDFQSIYKTDWDKINFYSGNDKLVKTCWDIKVETGSVTSGYPVHIKKITDLSVRDFREERIIVNGCITLTRIL